jgi:hypothetical protein
MGTPLAWIGILIAWNVFDEIFWPIFTFAIGLLYPGLYSWR